MRVCTGYTIRLPRCANANANGIVVVVVVVVVAPAGDNTMRIDDGLANVASGPRGVFGGFFFALSFSLFLFFLFPILIFSSFHFFFGSGLGFVRGVCRLW